MKNQFLLFVSALFLVFTACDDQQPEPQLQNATNKMGGQQVLNFRTHLSGDQEPTPVDTKATGQAIFQLSKDGTALSYKLIVANIENVTMAHIHVAPVGVNGGVVVWLYPSTPPPSLIPGTTNGILAEGVITTADLRGSLMGKNLSDLLDLMVAGQTYVNVHTTQNPGGEIRGQIMGNVKETSL